MTIHLIDLGLSEPQSRTRKGSITFLNPNDPEQPSPGVYGWFDVSSDRAVYIGRSGGKANAMATPSTLYRGIQEARRSCLSSDKNRTVLDTDFIVGSALLYLKRKGRSCVWKHLSDNPAEERVHWERLCPMLQRTSTSISRVFRIRKPAGGRWNAHDISLAERLLEAVFDRELESVP